jgi:acyl carrier protein
MSDAQTGPPLPPEPLGNREVSEEQCLSDPIAERVIAVIARMQKIPVESITLDKAFAELNIDSLDGINIAFEVESEFGIEIPDEDVKTIRSVRQMAEGIEKLLALKQV